MLPELEPLSRAANRSAVEHFRFAGQSDLRALEDLQRRTALHTGDYREQILAHPDAIAIPAEFITNQFTRVAIAREQILGFSIIVPLRGATAELDGLFVAPEFMRNGVGRALLQDAFQIALGRRIQRIEVTSNPRAIGFYEKIGFIGDAKVETRFAPALRMHLELDRDRSSASFGHPIQSERLQLSRIHLRDYEALRSDPEKFAKDNGLAQARLPQDFVPPAERDAAIAIEWDGFYVVLQSERRLVGMCGSRKYPNSTGEVEIAYGIAPEFEGRGFATEVARALVGYGFQRAEVRCIVAHTLPHPNASGRVLTKAGFRQSGEAMDPDEGRVWKWEIHR
jgi:RimJ/RimL family protein N-acetyltransferase